jgi:phage replication O-like protein O
VANPQRENGHIDIANEIVEQLARINLSAYEWRVLWAVLRKTYGWHKKSDSVPVSQIVEITGMRQPHVSRAKASLLKKQLLFEQAEKIGFQKNYELWVVKGFTNTDTGMEYTDSGMSTYTNSGRGYTDTGMDFIPNQGDSKEKKETTQKKESKLSAESFAAYWNSKPNLPHIRAMTDDRKAKLKARMKEPEFAGHWKHIIDTISASAFLTGDNDRGWKARVGWLLKNSANYVKVLEGYDNKPSRGGRTDTKIVKFSGPGPTQEFLRTQLDELLCIPEKSRSARDREDIARLQEACGK